jgi:hypothetical protein
MGKLRTQAGFTGRLQRGCLLPVVIVFLLGGGAAVAQQTTS